MNLVKIFPSQHLIPGFLINSLPKGGTHLLEKAVTLFPEIKSRYLHIGQSTLAQFQKTDDLGAINIPIGVGFPNPVSLSSIQKCLHQLKNKKGCYATAHIPFSEVLANLINGMDIKSLLILRDPRDVVISHANYIIRTPSHFLCEYYQTLSESERIMKSITGLESEEWNLLNIYNRYQSVLRWSEQSFNYTTYFESLVGTQGGGSRDAQIQELKNITHHLGIKSDSKEINQIADKVFGGTATFSKGAIGNWQNHFSIQHKEAFKELAGEMLIQLRYETDLNW